MWADTIGFCQDLESAAEVDELESSPRYIFAGFAAETIVVLLVPEAVIVYSIEDIDKLWYLLNRVRGRVVYV